MLLITKFSSFIKLYKLHVLCFWPHNLNHCVHLYCLFTYYTASIFVLNSHTYIWNAWAKILTLRLIHFAIQHLKLVNTFFYIVVLISNLLVYHHRPQFADIQRKRQVAHKTQRKHALINTRETRHMKNTTTYIQTRTANNRKS